MKRKIKSAAAAMVGALAVPAVIVAVASCASSTQAATVPPAQSTIATVQPRQSQAAAHASLPSLALPTASASGDCVQRAAASEDVTITATAPMTFGQTLSVGCTG